MLMSSAIDSCPRPGHPCCDCHVGRDCTWPSRGRRPIGTDLTTCNPECVGGICDWWHPCGPDSPNSITCSGLVGLPSPPFVGQLGSDDEPSAVGYSRRNTCSREGSARRIVCRSSPRLSIGPGAL